MLQFIYLFVFKWTGRTCSCVDRGYLNGTSRRTGQPTSTTNDDRYAVCKTGGRQTDGHTDGNTSGGQAADWHITDANSQWPSMYFDIMYEKGRKRANNTTWTVDISNSLRISTWAIDHFLVAFHLTSTYRDITHYSWWTICRWLVFFNSFRQVQRHGTHWWYSGSIVYRISSWHRFSSCVVDIQSGSYFFIFRLGSNCWWF